MLTLALEAPQALMDEVEVLDRRGPKARLWRIRLRPHDAAKGPFVRRIGGGIDRRLGSAAVQAEALHDLMFVDQNL